MHICYSKSFLQEVCKRLRPAFEGQNAEPIGKLLGREVRCQAWLARDKTVAKVVCLYWTGGGKKGTVSSVLEVKYIEES